MLLSNFIFSTHFSLSVFLYGLLDKTANSGADYYQEVTKRLGVGWIAAFLASTVTYPLDTVRRLVQSGDSSGRLGKSVNSLSGFKAIMKTRGVLGLYSGFIVSTCGLSTGTAIHLYFIDRCKDFLSTV
jgi:hypothetical protein